MNTEKITQELDAMSERINAIKAEINKPERVAPKEGEWWYFDNGYTKGVIKFKIIIGSMAEHTEGYFESHANFNDWCDNRLTHLATTDEITHFMGLHAERLGMKEGVMLDRSKMLERIRELDIIIKIVPYEDGTYLNDEGDFQYKGWIVRDSQGNWAEVVKDDKVVVNGVEIEYTYDREIECNTVTLHNADFYSQDEIESLYKLTNSPELKTILDGFKKQK